MTTRAPTANENSQKNTKSNQLSICKIISYYIFGIFLLGVVVVSALIYKSELVPNGRHGIVITHYSKPYELPPGTYNYMPISIMTTFPTASDKDQINITSCITLDGYRIMLPFTIVNHVDENYYEIYTKYYLPYVDTFKDNDKDFFPYDILLKLNNLVAQECAHMTGAHAALAKTWVDKGRDIAQRLDNIVTRGLAVTDVIITDKPTRLNEWYFTENVIGDLDSIRGSVRSSFKSNLVWWFMSDSYKNVTI